MGRDVYVIIHVSIHVGIHDDVALYSWRLFFVIENGLGLGWLGLGLNCEDLRSSPISLICDVFWKIVTEVNPWRYLKSSQMLHSDDFLVIRDEIFSSRINMILVMYYELAEV
jgi:hypothetical protein